MRSTAAKPMRTRVAPDHFSFKEELFTRLSFVVILTISFPEAGVALAAISLSLKV